MSAVIDLSSIMKEPDVLYCYNPSNKALEHDCDGDTFVFCPESCNSEKCLKERRHAMGSGISPVHGRVRVIKKNSEVVKTWPTSARQIVAFLCGEDGRTGPLGKAGLRPITGDPQTDDIIRQDAYKAWREKRYMDARAKVRIHEAQVALAKTDPNVQSPAMTKDVDEAYSVMREEAHAGNAPLAAYPCTVCNAPMYTQQELEVHQRDAHGKAQTEGNDALVAAISKLASQPTDNSVLIKQNEILTVKLAELAATVAELKNRKPGRKAKE